MTDFPDDFIERLFLKKALTEKNYLSVISSTFDIRWCLTKDISVLIDLALRYFRKYDDRPSMKIVQLLLSKAIESRTYCSSDRKSKYYNFYDELNYDTANGILVDTINKDFGVSEVATEKNIAEYIKKRALYFAMSDNIEEMERTGSVDKCLATFEKFQKLTFQKNDLGMNYFNPEDMEKHWEYLKNPEAKLSTGWDGLDEKTNGGFYKQGKCLCCFMGQAGLGKSLFLANLAVNFLKQDKSVVVISLEMSQDVYAQRFDSAISKHNINKLGVEADDAENRIKEFYKTHPNANLFIKEYPPRSIKTTDVEIYLDNLKEAGHNFDAVIVDYLNLVLPPTSRDNMYQDILCVSEKLRALSYKYEVPFITATQTSSQGLNNEDLGLEHISESRGLGHTLDFLGGLLQFDNDRENGIISMRILKNRFGGNVGAVIPFKLDPYNLSIEDLTFNQRNEVENRSEATELLRNLPDISADIDAM